MHLPYVPKQSQKTIKKYLRVDKETVASQSLLQFNMLPQRQNSYLKMKTHDARRRNFMSDLDDIDQSAIY